MIHPLRVALVGLGKIAHDQHLPTLARSPDFQLIAAASPAGSAPGIPVFPDLAALLASGLPLDAVVLCQPPQARFEAASLALNAGKHVLLEKPPATSPEQLARLHAMVRDSGSILFTAWHSRFAAAVAPARAWLANRTVRHVQIRWLEDVRQWHPNQAWIWERGGLGVFDPGINALSILTHLVVQRLGVRKATLWVPANREMPIAAQVGLKAEDPQSPTTVAATFDWRHTGPPCWSIRFDTDDGVLLLHGGGARLDIDGISMPVSASGEYPALYRRFADLIRAGQSEVDAEPLRLTEAALSQGQIQREAPFLD